MKPNHLSQRALAPVYADLAEITVSDPDFRKADGALFKSTFVSEKVILGHMAAKDVAKDVLFDVLLTHRRSPENEKHWEMSRVAALKELGGSALGAFSGYFMHLNGESPESNLTYTDLPNGEESIIKTNSRIIGASKNYEDPAEFLDTSLAMIDRRKSLDSLSVGPENYATALKFFADKYSNLEDPMSDMSTQDVNRLVGEAVAGFIEVGRKDQPNFVEMTNIYTSLRILPKGSVDQSLTRPLLEYSLSLLPEYPNDTITTLLGALPKLDLKKDGEIAARLVDLSLRKSKKFEKTNDFRIAIRAIEVLPKGEASEQVFRTFLTYRNDLETSLDLDGTDEMVQRLRNIADNVITSPELHFQIKTLSERAARQASELCKRYVLEGTLTTQQAVQIGQTFSRIMANYNAI